MGRIKAIILHHDKTLTVKRVKTDENRLLLKKGKQDYNPSFSPECIFLQHKTLPFPRTEQCVILVDGKQEVEKLHDGLNSMSNEMLFTDLTVKETEELIKREVAKARMRIKPVTLHQFIILVMLQIVILVFIIMLMSGVTIGR